MSDSFDSDYPTLDAGIREYVRVLRAGGVETVESCQGGDGHSYCEPTIRFHGNQAAGWHALSVALDHGLPIMDLRRTWPVDNGVPTGPYWELTFRTAA